MQNKGWAGSLKNEGGSDTSDPIRGVCWGQFMMFGVLVARKELFLNQKIGNVRAEGKKSMSICAGNFKKKIQLLLISLILKLRKLRSRKVKLHWLNSKTSTWTWNLWFLAQLSIHICLFLSLIFTWKLSHCVRTYFFHLLPMQESFRTLHPQCLASSYFLSASLPGQPGQPSAQQFPIWLQGQLSSC